MELSSRKRQILQVAIEDYITACSPITSGALKGLSSINCSTATLRAELNALEAMGFLRQLHTSGGRVPTAEGYRFYVESLLGNLKATNGELENVRELIENRTSSLGELVSSIAKVVSEATNYPTVVMLDGVENLRLVDFQIIPLLNQKVLVLIGTSSGYINETLDVAAGKSECDDAADFLKNRFVGKSILDLTESLESGALTHEIATFQTIVDGLVSGLKRFNSRKLLEVQRSGTRKLLDVGAQNVRNLFELLDNEDELVEVLATGENEEDISITIAEAEEDCSVIKVPVKVGESMLSIGVIGPQRMDYGGVSAALKLLVDELNNLKGESP